MSKPTDWTPSLWTETFEELLYSELDNGDQWSLNFSYSQTKRVTKEEKKRGWEVHCNRTFAKFRCGSCRNVWHSARAVVLFRYRLRGHRGTVIMRPCGQACRECNNDKFHLPGFSKKEVEQALTGLIREILKDCYRMGDQCDDGSKRSCKKKTKPHEKDLCQACDMGICSDGDD